MKHWLDILRCPISREALGWLDGQELDAVLNDFSEELKGGGSTNGKGYPLFHEALVSESGNIVYPVIDGIPILLAGAALQRFPRSNGEGAFSKEKQKVLDFYDSLGWTSSEAGDYEDAVIYEDLRPVSSAYIAKCHDRINRHLPPKGKYLLDAACGAIQFPVYLSYSQNFEHRVCVDFSLLALKEARKKLGDKGIYILCDITHMPFRENVMDAFISLHTIYHIPASEQVKAVEELWRVLAPSGKGVVVYDWFKHSIWMNLALLPFRAFVYLKNRVVRSIQRLRGDDVRGGRLYFFAHRYDFLRKNLPPFRLYVWRSVSVPFLKYYVHRWLFGRRFLRWLYRMEERHPERCGEYGEYPMMVFQKG